ncbi:MAG: addiction module protein [Verrucomicrobiota bacterium]
MVNVIDRSKIDELSTQDRLELLGEIWGSLSNDADALPLSEAQKTELDHRLKLMETDHDRGIPWEKAQQILSGDSE